MRGGHKTAKLELTSYGCLRSAADYYTVAIASDGFGGQCFDPHWSALADALGQSWQSTDGHLTHTNA